ncbi:hypothetical protein Tco_0517175 [Tanacetum coccineum]
MLHMGSGRRKVTVEVAIGYPGSHFEPHWCCICEKSEFKHVLTRSSKPSEGHTEWYTEKHIDNTVVNVGVSSDNNGPERTQRSMPENIPMTTNSPCLIIYGGLLPERRMDSFRSEEYNTKEVDQTINNASSRSCCFVKGRGMIQHEGTCPPLGRIGDEGFGMKDPACGRPLRHRRK